MSHEIDNTCTIDTCSTAAMDQYTTKEDVLKLAVVDPELEEVRSHRLFWTIV